MRDYRCSRRGNHVHDHRTDRKCTVCGGILYDTIINFGENLNDYAWDPAEENATKSDCCLVLGSSLTVTPAANLPEMVGEKKKGTFCIVNLQKTNMDNLCDVRIFAKCDDVMRLLMKKLNLEIPEWKLKRYIKVSVDTKKNVISIFGVDSDGTPYDILSGIKLIIKGDDVYEKSGLCLDGGIFKINNKIDLNTNEIALQLSFMCHYNEPSLMIDLKKYFDSKLSKFEFTLNLDYCPYKGQWNVYCGDENEKQQNNDDMKNNDDNDNNDDELKNEKEDIFVGNMHELDGKEEDNKHIWTMFVSNDKDKLNVTDTIESVIYDLHPTFRPSQVTVKDAPFLLVRRGWGYFDVGVTIKFKKETNREDIQCSHGLDFNHDVTMTHIHDDENENKVHHLKGIKKFRSNLKK